jgi:hypothetical protein
MFSDKEDEMIKTGYYVRKQAKLIRQFEKLMDRYEQPLIAMYGEPFAAAIRGEATELYIELIPRIPYYKTPLYRPIILLNSRLVAIIKAMEKHGKSVEDIVRIQAVIFRQEYSKIPALAGRVYLSKLAGRILSKMAAKGTAEGWIAEVVHGTEEDNFDLSVVTKSCGLVDYLESEGMKGLINYCNFSDFIMFPSMSIGLRQTSTIDQGKCVYCMSLGGVSEIPDSLENIYAQNKQQTRCTKYGT